MSQVSYNSSRKRFFALLATPALLLGYFVLSTTPVAAEVQSLPVSAPFNAPICGEAEYYDGYFVEQPWADEPFDENGDLRDMTHIFGERLASYNSGNVVPLYDAYASAIDSTYSPYPPVCGTRFVEGVGPVSEWMFCTDYFSWVCSRTNNNGDIIGDDDLGPDDSEIILDHMEELNGRNPKLTEDQERLIAYLAHHGDLEITPIDNNYFSFDGADRAYKDGDVFALMSLQVLIWCISDPVELPPYEGEEGARAAFCELNMGAERQAELLKRIPVAPEITLDLDSAASNLAPGETAAFTLTTNIFDHPFDVEISGVAGTLVFDGASYDPVAGTITVPSPADNSTAPVQISGSFTTLVKGSMTMHVSAQPGSVESVVWNQVGNPYVDIEAKIKPCQVFATFRQDLVKEVHDQASFVFADEVADGDDVSEGTTEGETSDGADMADGSEAELADSGIGDSPVPYIALGGALLLFGIVAIIIARRKTNQK